MEPKPAWPKACGCGETWSRAQWDELPVLGRYRADELLEVRSCVCGSNLAVPTRELEGQLPSSAGGPGRNV